MTHLALTHPHFDHVFGAAAFTGAEVFGAAGPAGAFTDGREELRRGRGAQRARLRRARAAADRLVRPGHRVSGEVALDLGGGRQVAAGERGPRPHRARPGGPGPGPAGPGGERPGRSSAATWSRSPANPRRAPTRYRPAGPRLWTGCSRWAARTRVYVPGSRSGGGRRVRTGPAGRAGRAFRRVAVSRRRDSPIVMRMRQYSPDLTPPWKKPEPVPGGPGGPGLVVEEPGTGFCGAVIRCEAGTVTLEDRFGKHRVFPMEPRGFLLEGRAVTLVRPAGGRPRGPARTASGSVAVPGARARVARAGRIYVEGRHDAELVERSGATTCASRAWSWSTWRASTTSRRSSPSSPRARTPGSASSSTTWCPARRSPVSPRSVTSEHALVRRPPVHRHLGGREAVLGGHRGLAAGAARRRTGRRACAGRWAGRRTRARPGSTSCPGCAPTRTWSRNCWAGWRN